LGVPLAGLALFAFLPLPLALPIYFVSSTISAFIWVKVLQAMRVPVISGMAAMIGQPAQVRSWSGRQGQVLYHGELWNARSLAPRPLSPGDLVKIDQVEGLRLWVC